MKRYTMIGQFQGLATFNTPYGEQPWILCRTRKSFLCVKTGQDWPEKTFAWRPVGNPRNRFERISAEGLLDSCAIALATLRSPHQRRLAKAMARENRPMMLSRLSHRASLSHRTANRALDALVEQGLMSVVDDADPTADWYQGDGTEREDCVIDFSRR